MKWISYKKILVGLGKGKKELKKNRGIKGVGKTAPILFNKAFVEIK